ncbi:MAG: pyrroloquinoline quinone biosynthesis protein PqqE [Myxococcales bacterium]|nr:MAG: pyrroloquinoline quinone biosynthesis protein PqqE [Myxococcales bacterium]
MTAAAPRLLTLVAELTYGCKLRCAYCSNPVEVAQRAPALSAGDWLRVIEQAEEMGALQVHFTGGEPLLFQELELLVGRAREKQLYTNLITSGVPLSRDRLRALERAGLDHVQLSFQAASSASNLRIAGIDATAQKLEVARWAKELELPLTVNLVLHRENLGEIEQLLALAESLEPHRIELANAQYLGWALRNRERLLPSAHQLEEARQLAAASRERLAGKTDVLFVLPDYYGDRPRACMQGWASSYLVVTPDGLALPCQAARDLPGLLFDDVRSAPLAEIWARSPALGAFRGADWLPQPCRGCAERERDFGGCRCQAFALTGDASAPDPACSVTPSHHLIRSARQRAELGAPSAPLELRRAPRRLSVE